MKRIVQFLRFAVGGLFIFSGLVKANDPMGLAYKMEEFFELWKWFGLIPYTKSFSVIMNALEIIAGFALCIGWQNKWNLRLLMSLILFFTALTGYTYYTGYPKTCGCFGDCLPISAATSFFKDIFLCIAIGILFLNPSTIRGLQQRVSEILMGLIFLFAFGLQLYVLYHLPIVDCLPYQVGVDINEARKQPPPPPGSTVMFVYKKDGVEVAFSADRFPADFSADTYQFVRRYETGEIPQPKIQGFVLTSSVGIDSTEAILGMEKVFLLFSEDIGKGPSAWGKGWGNLIGVGKSKNIPLVLVSNQPSEWTSTWSDQYPQVYRLSSDRTPIRTAARVNPTVYLLEQGVIVGKWALTDFPALEMFFF
jgi:hypothetical protein